MKLLISLIYAIKNTDPDRFLTLIFPKGISELLKKFQVINRQEKALKSINAKTYKKRREKCDA